MIDSSEQSIHVCFFILLLLFNFGPVYISIFLCPFLFLVLAVHVIFFACQSLFVPKYLVTVNPLLSAPGGLIFFKHFFLGGGGLKERGGAYLI